MEKPQGRDLQFLHFDPNSFDTFVDSEEGMHSAFEPPTPLIPVTPGIRKSMSRKLGRALSYVLMPQTGWSELKALRSPPRRTMTLGKLWEHPSEEVDITISLSREMDLFFTDPDASVGRIDDMRRRAEWKLRVSKEGKLKPVGSKTEVSTLYWEASFTPSEVDSPFSPRFPPDSIMRQKHIWTWKIDDSNSVIVPVETSIQYTRQALLCLGLDVDEAESFLSFLLPSFRKHAHVALRFAPQAMYTAIAPLTITPPPEILTRILLLYKGVKQQEINARRWQHAQQRATEKVEFWKGVVGIDAGSSVEGDLERSRVLEWAAMEMR